MSELIDNKPFRQGGAAHGHIYTIKTVFSKYWGVKIDGNDDDSVTDLTTFTAGWHIMVEAQEQVGVVLGRDPKDATETHFFAEASEWIRSFEACRTEELRVLSVGKSRSTGGFDSKYTSVPSTFKFTRDKQCEADDNGCLIQIHSYSATQRHSRNLVKANGQFGFPVSWSSASSTSNKRGGGRGGANICKVRLAGGDTLDCVGPGTHLTPIAACVSEDFDPMDVLLATNENKTPPVKLRVLYQSQPGLLYRRGDATAIFEPDRPSELAKERTEQLSLVALREACDEGTMRFFSHKRDTAIGATDATSGPVAEPGTTTATHDDDDNGWTQGEDEEDALDEELLTAARTISALGEQQDDDDVVPYPDDPDFEDDGNGGGKVHNPALLSYVTDLMAYSIPTIRRFKRVHYPKKIHRMTDAMNIPLPASLQGNQSTVPSKAVATRYRKLSIVYPYSFCPEYAPAFGCLKCPYCKQTEGVRLNGFTRGIRSVVAQSEPYGCILRRFKCHGCSHSRPGYVSRSFTIMHDDVLSQMDDAFIEMLEVRHHPGRLSILSSDDTRFVVCIAVSRVSQNLRRYVSHFSDQPFACRRGIIRIDLKLTDGVDDDEVLASPPLLQRPSSPHGRGRYQTCECV